TVILAALLGLFLGAVIAIMREVMAPKVGLRDQINGLIDVPILGTIATAPGALQRSGRKNTAREEALTVLAANFRHRANESGATTCAVMDTRARPGHRPIPEDLIDAMSRGDGGALLVDANLRGRSGSLPGLSEVLRDQVSLEDA